MTAHYCGQPVRLAAPRPPLVFSLFSVVLFPASLLTLSPLWKWASVQNDLQPHPEGTKRRIVAGWREEQDKHWWQRDSGKKKRSEEQILPHASGENGKSLLLEASGAQSWIWQERWLSIPFLTSLIKPLTLKWTRHTHRVAERVGVDFNLCGRCRPWRRRWQKKKISSAFDKGNKIKFLNKESS